MRSSHSHKAMAQHTVHYMAACDEKDVKAGPVELLKRSLPSGAEHEAEDVRCCSLDSLKRMFVVKGLRSLS